MIWDFLGKAKSRKLQSMRVASGESHQGAYGTWEKTLERISEAVLESQVLLLKETQAFLAQAPYFRDEEERRRVSAPWLKQEAKALAFHPGHFVLCPGAPLLMTSPNSFSCKFLLQNCEWSCIYCSSYIIHYAHFWNDVFIRSSISGCQIVPETL